MTAILAVAFWVAVAVLGWVYVGYPLAAALAGRLRPLRVRTDGPLPSLVTVGIAAYDAAPVLAARIADILAQEVPFELEVVVASDGSTDATASTVGAIAEQDGRVRLLDLPRTGQTGAQNAIFDVARGEVVVLSDAETRFAPGCLRALVRPMADDRIGCTTGVLRWQDERATGTVRGEGAYWRYEQWVRGMESRAGWLTAVTGALLATRRSLYQPVPVEASMDHLLPLYVREAGYRVVAVPDAIGTDRGVLDLRAQFRNRSRTATRGIRANRSMIGRLAPWRSPSAALAIWSHKLLRWATPWLVGVAVIAAAVLGVSGSPAYLVVVAVAALGGLLAVVGYAMREQAHPPRWASLPLAVAVVNLAFLNGWFRVLRGERISAWHETDWQAGRTSVSGSGRSKP